MIRKQETGISRQYKNILAFGVMLMLISSAFSQTFKAVAELKEVPQNYTFDVTYTVENGDLEKFNPPRFEGFDAYGPSSSQNISIINGRMSKSVSYTYTLQPRKQGEFIIPAATAIVNGKTLQSNTLTIKVSAPQKQPTAAQQPSADPYGQGNRQGRRSNSESDVRNEIAKNIFVVVTPTRKTVYEGDQLTLSYKLYFRIQYQGLNVMKAPSYNGFLSEEFKLDLDKDPEVEVYNGRKYYAQEFKRIALFPQKAGKYTIEPMQFAGTVFIQVPDPFFNDPFFSTMEPYQYSFQSNPLDIEVLPLPKPQPANYSGAVGNFAFAANYDKTKVKVNEPISLKVSYTGTGNLKLIQAPKLEFPESFEAYPPKVKETYTTEGSVISGVKSFEYILVPQDGGQFTMPAYTFAYFDPEKKKYVTFELPETNIDVTGTAAPSANLKRILQNDKTAAKKEDIYDIAARDGHTTLFYGSPVFWGLGAAPIGLLLLGFVFRRRQYNEGELLLLRRRKATRMAMKRLATAKKRMHPNTEKAFYDEVVRALWQYISDKLYIKTSDLSRENIEQELSAREVSADSISNLIAMLDTCEMALFSQQGRAEHMRETYDQAVKWITETDEQLTQKAS